MTALTPVPEGYTPGVFLPPCGCGEVACRYWYDAELDVYSTICAGCKLLRHTMTPAEYALRRDSLARLGVEFRAPTREEIQELQEDEF